MLSPMEYRLMRLLAPVIFLLLFSSPSSSHDIYVGLKDASGRPCCDNGDCRPALYRISPSGVHMLVEGVWITVPGPLLQYRLLYGDTGETAGGHWCGFTEERDPELKGGPPLTFCAILPPSFAARP
jgi:hypothetical protein